MRSVFNERFIPFLLARLPRPLAFAIIATLVALVRVSIGLTLLGILAVLLASVIEHPPILTLYFAVVSFGALAYGAWTDLAAKYPNRKNKGEEMTPAQVKPPKAVRGKDGRWSVPDSYYFFDNEESDNA